MAHGRTPLDKDGAGGRPNPGGDHLYKDGDPAPEPKAVAAAPLLDQDGGPAPRRTNGAAPSLREGRSGTAERRRSLSPSTRSVSLPLVTMPRGRQSGVNSSSQRASQLSTSQNDEDSDMDEGGPSQSATGSQAQRNLDKLTPAAVDRKVSEVVQYILIMEQRKIPVKRKDIIKHVLKDYRSRYVEILKRTTKTFHQVSVGVQH
ncbi:uncharacterized protein [Scyliorhinus torazame]|uniref:uncharacterized protein isoform X2 n=1 Tax=Scyliorhinus torazame TaxID=75743 RepID=UPI003B5969A6